MRHPNSKLVVVIFLSAFLTAWGWASDQQRDLTLSDLPRLKSKPCTLLHVWATWCGVCVMEMPSLFQWLREQKKIHAVVIDASSLEAQEGFSKKWMAQLNPPFPVYFNATKNDKAFQAAIDRDWDGALPYFALYHNGKKERVWLGKTPWTGIKEAVDKFCSK